MVYLGLSEQDWLCTCCHPNGRATEARRSPWQLHPACQPSQASKENSDNNPVIKWRSRLLPERVWIWLRGVFVSDYPRSILTVSDFFHGTRSIRKELDPFQWHKRHSDGTSSLPVVLVFFCCTSSIHYSESIQSAEISLSGFKTFLTAVDLFQMLRICSDDASRLGVFWKKCGLCLDLHTNVYSRGLEWFWLHFCLSRIWSVSRLNWNTIWLSFIVTGQWTECQRWMDCTEGTRGII